MMLRLAADYERLADRAELHTQGTHQNAKQQNPAHREERLGGFYGPIPGRDLRLPPLSQPSHGSQFEPSSRFPAAITIPV